MAMYSWDHDHMFGTTQFSKYCLVLMGKMIFDYWFKQYLLDF